VHQFHFSASPTVEDSSSAGSRPLRTLAYLVANFSAGRVNRSEMIVSRSGPVIPYVYPLLMASSGWREAQHSDGADAAASEIGNLSVIVRFTRTSRSAVLVEEQTEEGFTTLRC
jgi:hypothetical protein